MESWLFFLLVMFIAVCMLQLFDNHQSKHRCPYCGEFNGKHDTHCPWGMILDD